MKFRKSFNFLVIAALIVLTIAGCGSSGNNATTAAATTAQQTTTAAPAETTQAKAAETTTEAATETAAEELPWLEYSIWVMDRNWGKWSDNPNDVVTPYIEDRFHVRVTEVTAEDDQPYSMWLNLWIASGTMPDVIKTSMHTSIETINKGVVADLTDYIRKMPNYNKYYPKQMENVIANADGRLFQIVCPDILLNNPPYSEDPWVEGSDRHCLWVREDFLEQLGYSFTSMEELKKQTLDVGKKPTIADFAIDPPLATPDDFYDYLKKVQDLNLKVDDKPVYPLSMVNWQHFHYGTMFDFGTYTLDKDTREVKFYLDSPGAKPYFKWLNKLYKEKLLDGDSFIQMDEQLQEKIASARTGAGFNSLDMIAARQGMAKVVPGARIRYIAWPRGEGNKGYYNVYNGGVCLYMVNAKSFTDEELSRLTQYWDWFYSDEGFDLCAWGPEEAGLWEMKDGKKVFKDASVADAVLNGIHDKNGADFYGLYDKFGHGYNMYWSKSAACSPLISGYNPFSAERSYPPNLDINLIARNMLGEAGFSTEGWAADNDGTEVTTDVVNFYWNDIMDKDIPSLVVSETDAAFDAAWEAVLAKMYANGYAEAKVAMKEWFDKYGPK